MTAGKVPNTPFDLRCQVWPSEKLLRRAKRWCGEGFTWTCPSCGEQFVLVQGKGDFWTWRKLEEIRS